MLGIYDVAKGLSYSVMQFILNLTKIGWLFCTVSVSAF
jgi:hypothetical protein